MNASIVTIGDEILVGQIINTNSTWLAEQLNLIGIEVIEILSISDRSEHIMKALQHYAGKTDLLLITGGLGPTKDDITKDTLAKFFRSNLVFHQEVYEHIRELFSKRGLKILDVNKKQAMLPDNCTVLHNPSGTAQGMWFEKEGTIYVSMPGVPYELKDIMQGSVLPMLSSRLKGSVIVHKTLMTQGIPESYLSERLQDWENNLPAQIKLAYLPKPGIVRLRLSARGTNRSELQQMIEIEADKAIKIISKDVYGFDNDTLEKVIRDLLLEKKATLAIAESCTGGYISHLITSVPGSSGYFLGSVIAYANQIKIRNLGVDPEKIKKFGAVSREVVIEMAKGVIDKFGSDYAIATSGIAGPDGGTKEKPVGTTWLAVASKENVVAAHFLFGEHRGRNIEKASVTALNMLRKLILKIN